MLENNSKVKIYSELMLFCLLKVLLQDLAVSHFIGIIKGQFLCIFGKEQKYVLLQVTNLWNLF